MEAAPGKKQRPSPKHKDSGAETPLHIATIEGDIDELRRLIRQNVFDINATGSRNFTALHFAANAGNLEVSTSFTIP